VLTAGALVQDAAANNDGTSAACAGVVGPGGAIQIGPSGSCLVSGTQPSGVILDLGLGVLRADSITASCTASSSGGATGAATLVNARITDPTGSITLLTLPVSPAPDSGLGLPGIVTLTLNQQPPVGPGQITVTSLDLTVLSGVNSGARVSLGTVTCGPNAQTPPIPIISSAGLPFAGGAVLALGVLLWLVRRRRPSMGSDG
jgi:hypothetical protein